MIASRVSVVSYVWSWLVWEVRAWLARIIFSSRVSSHPCVWRCVAVPKRGTERSEVRRWGHVRPTTFLSFIVLRDTHRYTYKTNFFKKSCSGCFVIYHPLRITFVLLCVFFLFVYFLLNTWRKYTKKMLHWLWITDLFEHCVVIMCISFRVFPFLYIFFFSTFIDTCEARRSTGHRWTNDHGMCQVIEGGDD